MSSDANPVKSIFLAAVAKSTPDQVSAYLEEACGGDEALRRRVQILREAHAGMIACWTIPPPRGEAA
jgi:hypothetical protein